MARHAAILADDLSLKAGPTSATASSLRGAPQRDRNRLVAVTLRTGFATEGADAIVWDENLACRRATDTDSELRGGLSAFVGHSESDRLRPEMRRRVFSERGREVSWIRARRCGSARVRKS